MSDKKNIVVIPMIIPKDKNLDKFGGWEWMLNSKTAWEFWCKKNNYELVIFDEPSIEDTTKYKITVQRWFDIFDFLDKKKIEYDQVCMVDASYIPKWDCPDFFELTDNKFATFQEQDNFKWVYESIQGYKRLFNNYELDILKYFHAGFVIFNKSHKSVFEKFKNMYINNIDELTHIQGTLRRGTDQTPLNYVMSMNNVDMKFLPMKYRVSHLPRKEFLSYNWQLNEDKTPFFIKYGYIWGFGGFGKRERNKILDQTWKLVRHNYFENPTIEFLLESIGEDKHTNPATTSNKFKSDVWEFFKDFKDKVCVEFGTHKGQTTKILSYCFKKVYTINKEIQSFDNAKMLNVGIDNIKYVPFDLYSDEKLSIKNVSVFMIDAGHKYTQVVSDLDRCIDMSDIQDSYIIFDDYGLDVHEKEVKRAVDEYISANKIQVVKKIGHSSGHTFGGSLGRTLKDNEGLICRIVK